MDRIFFLLAVTALQSLHMPQLKYSKAVMDYHVPTVLVCVAIYILMKGEIHLL